MINYLKNQIEEIKNTPGLCLFGAFLSVSHIYAITLWNKNSFFVSRLSQLNSEVICFPFFPNCDLYAVFSDSQLQNFLYFYLGLSLVTLFCFLQKKLTTYAFALLFVLFIFKISIHLSNYNFMGNYHYMANIIYFSFLFVPNKKAIIKYLIVGFYFAAGLLKLNIEWLSGAAMISPPYIMGDLLVASLFYVVILELLFSFGLLSANKYIRWFSLAQFTAFHIFSWHIVGFFYPMMMFTFLSIFLIDEYQYYRKNLTPIDHLDLFIKLKEKPSTYLIIIIFSLMQIFPFMFTNDPSKSGALRLSSLNMFDAKVHCKLLIVAHKKGQVVHLATSRRRKGVRIQCDPVVYLNQVNQLCRKNKQTPEFDRLSISISSRRSTELDFKPVLFLKDACSQKNLLWAEYYKWGTFE